MSARRGWIAALVCAGCSASTEGGLPDAAWALDPTALADLAPAPAIDAGAAPDLAVGDLAAGDLASGDAPWADLAMVDLAAPDLAAPDDAWPDLAMRDGAPADLATRDLAPVDLAVVADLAVPDLAPPADSAPPRDLAVADGPACAGGRVRFSWDGGIGGPNDPFADRIVSYQPGANAGFGQGGLPKIVLGPPDGAGANLGSLDVLSLGNGGVIVLALDDIGIVDGPGPDLLVFENPTVNFRETGWVAVSDDGVNWHEWPCDPTDGAHDFPGCAGVKPVYANAVNGLDPTDPARAGGDAFDLATIGVARARYVRIRDSGKNTYTGVSGGFDLDAIAVVNGAPINCW